MRPPSAATLAAMRAAARHTCPICGREASPGVAPFPFCSSGCKLVDLGRWLDGGYRIPGPSLESSGELGGEPGGDALEAGRLPHTDGRDDE
jgi:endogenous inhibitor of DNA gyrase (YacG/DUF329 family)